MARFEQTVIESEEDTMKERYLTFLLGEETFGIGIGQVIEIVGLQPITQVPEHPDYLMGIMNLRGKIIPVMDVRTRFRLPFKTYHDRTCVIVVDIDGVLVGLVVDEVQEVLRIQDSDIVQPPSLKNGFSNRYIEGIGKVGPNIALLLNCDKLLNEKELSELSLFQ